MYPWPLPLMAFSFDEPLADGRKDVRVQEAPLELAPGEPLRLRIFLDHSIMEIFANGRQCLTQRIYPTRSDSNGIVFFSSGGSALVRRLEAWQMYASNPW